MGEPWGSGVGSGVWGLGSGVGYGVWDGVWGLGCFLGKTVSSRLGLRTEISARYYRQTTRTDVPHLFCFHYKCEKSDKVSIFWRNVYFRKYSLILRK